METKKIIAICQSGGEFVIDQDGSLTYRGGDAYAVDIDENTKLNSFKKELADIFSCNASRIIMKYLLPSNNKTLITVSKDRDLQRMVRFVGDFRSVDVFISLEDPPAQNGTKKPAARLTKKAVSVAAPSAAPPLEADPSALAPLSATVAPPDVVAPLPDAVAPPPDTVARSSDAVGPSEVETSNGVVDEAMEDVHNGTPLSSIPPTTSIENTSAIQWESTITGVGQRFYSFSEFKEALHKFSIARGFAYWFKKNDSHRVSAKCRSQGCSWRVYASRLSTTQLIAIKKMNPIHTCDGTPVKGRYQATRGWVGSIVKEKLKASPNYKAKEIAEEIMREYGIHLNICQARRAKKIVKEQLQGSHKEAYKLLPYLCEKIRETNPGSYATINTKDDSSFHRLFVAFQACISGFQQGCRPLLFLDSIPLLSKYQGVLLTAVSADGDDGIFPVAFAVVDTLTDDNWHWFLLELKYALSHSTQQTITFVADFQNGLKKSIAEVFPNGFHAYCLSNLAEKLNKDLRTPLSHDARRFMINDLNTAAHATRIEAFHSATRSIKGVAPEAFDWVMHSGSENWANALFSGSRYNHMSSNFGQEFFSWVVEAQELPITQFIEVLRGKIMEAIYTRRVNSANWSTKLTPSKEEKLQKEAQIAQSLHVQLSVGSTFEVHGGETVEVVDLENWTCSCKTWMITGLPCCHAIAVIERINKSVHDFCLRFFSTEYYRYTYAESINPVPSINEEEVARHEMSIMVTPPPLTKRPPGRPSIKAGDLLDLGKRQLQCSNCKGLGHNKKSCKAAVAATANNVLPALLP